MFSITLQENTVLIFNHLFLPRNLTYYLSGWATDIGLLTHLWMFGSRMNWMYIRFGSLSDGFFQVLALGIYFYIIIWFFGFCFCVFFFFPLLGATGHFQGVLLEQIQWEAINVAKLIRTLCFESRVSKR